MATQYKNFVIITDDNNKPTFLTTYANFTAYISDERGMLKLNNFDNVEQVKAYIDTYLIR